jgi:phospholipid/cholesterol/gamma-HCH transport system ATP-binding protein
VILDLKHELGVTTITITHDLKSAFEIADRIALLFRGEVIACQPPAEFKANPDPVIQQFLRGDAEGPFLMDPPPPKRSTNRVSHYVSVS